jgi:hypothetical protein
MAQVIRSSDILAICFIFYGNDLDTDMTGVIANAETYIQENDWWIGTGPDDFRNALFWLTCDTELSDIRDYEQFPENMKKVKLRDLIIPILSTRELSCNDEGEYWVGSYDLGNACNDNKDNWFDDFANPVDIEYEYEIRKFFASPRNLTNQSAAAFFREHGSRERILKLHLHNG